MTAWRRRPAAALAVLGCLASLFTGCGLVQNPDPQSQPQSHPPSSHQVNQSRPDNTPAPGRGAATTATETPPATSVTPTRTGAGEPYPGCHPAGDPRAGVNSPLRLIVRSRCIQVRGIVGCIFTDDGDGDTHLALLPESAEARRKYLTPGNRSWTCASDQGSDTAPRLVVEVIPQHCTVRPDNCADRGHFTNPKIPRNGQHVAVTGPWVQDTSTRYGRTLWSEIHPAWAITIDDDQ